ncbi:hypothetical protein [Neisseria sp.]|uniref:hypothetical protein n=1 Tax=Neisseria sp. TaxID=192066 RepID=UPI00359FF489
MKVPIYGTFKDFLLPEYGKRSDTRTIFSGIRYRRTAATKTVLCRFFRNHVVFRRPAVFKTHGKKLPPFPNYGNGGSIGRQIANGTPATQKSR